MGNPAERMDGVSQDVPYADAVLEMVSNPALAGSTLWLTDLGSSNGTFVNDVRLGEGDKTIVRDGDRLRFGDVELKLELQ